MDAFRDDPSVDFGGLVKRVPAEVRRPATVDALVGDVRALAASRTPYALRGSGHSASGETLIEGGTVLDLTRMRGVVADDPNTGEITALAGTTWLELWEHLAETGRRPLALTDNPRVTLGGTLAVGGIGEASHLYGPQVASVRRAVLVTPDGGRRELAAGDPLLAHALCGHGQLGALAEVTLATRRAATTMTGRNYGWGDLDSALADLAELRHDYVRARVVWNAGLVRAWAIVADTGASAPAAPKRAIQQSGVDRVDMLVHARIDPSAAWSPFNPCAELVLPYPAGLPALHRIDRAIASGPLARHFPRGSSLVLSAGTSGLPLSPFAGDRVIVLALRCAVATRADADDCAAPLRALAGEALAAGGRVYLASFPLEHDALARQLGGAAASLAELKTRVDPDDLCNRHGLHGWSAR